MPGDPEEIGKRIAEARREAGLTQDELAQLLGVSTRSVQSYEAGATVPYRHLGRLEEVTGKARSWVLGGDGLSVASLSAGLDAVNRELMARLRAQEELLVTLGDQLAHMQELRGELEQLRAEMVAMRLAGSRLESLEAGR